MTYGERANQSWMGEDSVYESLAVRGLDVIRKDLFDRELTKFISKMIDTDIIIDRYDDAI